MITSPMSVATRLLKVWKIQEGHRKGAACRVRVSVLALAPFPLPQPQSQPNPNPNPNSILSPRPERWCRLSYLR